MMTGKIAITGKVTRSRQRQLRQRIPGWQLISGPAVLG